MIADVSVSYPPIWNVPYQQNRFFTGREEVLSQLEESLHADNTACLAQPQGFSGLGGIGKTQAAVEYAYRHRADYRAVLWTRADSHSSLVADFVNIASLLQLPERNKSNQRLIVEAVMRWLHTHTQWLLIFDNVEDFTVANEFIPTTGSGHILLTTRSQAMGGIAQRIEIEKMQTEVGALLLLRRAGLLPLLASLDDALTEDRTLSLEITKVLDGLPLALSQAGAYIKETSCTLSAYLDLYYSRRAELLKERQGFDDTYPESVATTWSLSFEKIVQANPGSAELLHLFAFLYPEAIPEEIITEAAIHLGDVLEPITNDALQLEAVFKELLRYSLLERNADVETFTMHRLVQAVFKDRMDAGIQLLWAIRTVQAVNEIFPGVEYSTWPHCQRYVLHAQTCAALIEEWELDFSNAARLLNQTAAYLRIRAQYTEAEPLYQRALAIWEQTLGPEHTNVAACLNNLALLYERQGKYEQAESLYLRALAIWEKILDPLDATLAICLNNIAQIYRFQGKYEQAEPFYQRSLAIREQVWGPEHPNTATAYHNLASLYEAQGKYEQAEPLYQRALAIREQALGPTHPDVALSLDSLAILYTHQNKYRGAEALLLRTLHIQEKIYGPGHAETLFCLNNLALVYTHLARYEQAEELYQRVLHIRESTQGSWHPDTVDSFHNLASLYSTQGKYKEAEAFYQKALAGYEQVRGPYHPKTATCLNNLAELYRHLERFDEAELLYQRALAIHEQVVGTEHPHTLSNRANLALLYHDQKKYEQAEILYKEVIESRERLLGANHRDTATILHNLASLYRVQGKYDQAESLYRRVLAILEPVVGSEHPDVANVLYGLALVYTDSGRYEEAEAYYKQSFNILLQKLGAEHPRSRVVLGNYVHLLQEMGRGEDVVALLAPYSVLLKPTLEINEEDGHGR